MVPSLMAPGRAPRTWQSDAQTVLDAVREITEPIILVGHSGGGLLLPVIADAAAPPVAELVFVDSGVPAKTGATAFMPARFLEGLRKLAVGGMLPPWSDWWCEETMRDLVPDEALRAALVREMPAVPLAYLEQSIPSPSGWDRAPCAYLLLSDAYEEAAAEAEARGWQVERIRGAQHLHIAVTPRAVGDALTRLVERPTAGGSPHLH
jgi:pimeloyl-ACP methyl ester carboxylesterase